MVYIYHDMFPQYVWTITPTHGLLVAPKFAYGKQEDTGAGIQRFFYNKLLGI